jgi:hypothetical protein
MTKAAVPEDVFIAMFRGGRTVRSVAAELGVSVRAVQARKRRLEKTTGLEFERAPSPNPHGRNGWNPDAGTAYPFRLERAVSHGVAVVFGDLHCRPVPGRVGDAPALAALLRVTERLQPNLLINMGDALDGAALSRHPPLGWEIKPTIAEEIGGAQYDLARIRDAAPKAWRVWIVGNHDERYDRHLAMRVPEMRDLVGMRLSDSFPDWPMAWSLEINGSALFVHRWHGGVHARHNNLLKGGGAHVITADTHRSGVTHYTAQMGRTVHGVEVGCMAEPSGAQFQYTRGIRPNWQMGFAVLTWRDGMLLPPEKCLVDDAGRAWFRGECVAEKPRVRVRANAAG